MNIPPELYPLYEQGWLDDVIRPLMSGKEASVFLVISRGVRCVAKVYKDAQHRSFRQRASYTEGRQVRNSRQRRAMQKGTGYGKSLLEAEWQNAEVDALYRLYEANVRVPVPYHQAQNVLLMELVADADGEPAPRLYDFRLHASDALAVHQILIRDVVRMLCAGLVHGDLSEFNILIGADGPVIIDLPQATDAANNRNSERLFLRDVSHLANYLGRFAPELKKTRYGPEIWDLYSRAQLHPEVELTGRFVAKKSVVNTKQVLDEIEAAAEEARERPMSAYQQKKARQAEQARAARAAEAKRAAEPKRAAKPKRTVEPKRATKPKRAAESKRAVEPKRAAEPAAKPEKTQKPPRAKPKRRRRRRRGPAAGAAQGDRRSNS